MIKRLFYVIGTYICVTDHEQTNIIIRPMYGLVSYTKSLNNPFPYGTNKMDWRYGYDVSIIVETHI